ncbi:MAG: class I SAM-dependent methyltransferase [Acidobacteriota bacterium]
MTVKGEPIRNVSDTALWVAIYRAMESERPDALFQDPFARRLAGERGETIVRTMHSGQSMAWPMIVRTAVMDEILLRCVAQGARTVLNLAAGLDARPYRLDLPRDLRWLHVDLPPMIDYVRGQLAGETPRCRLEYVAADLTDAAARTAAIARAAGGGPAFAICEGLLIYLEAEQVAGLARELHAQPELRWWLIDLASPQLLKMLAKRWGPGLAAGNAPMKFGPAEGTAFFAPYGWREAEFRSTWDESFRLRRTMRLGWLWRALGKLSSRERQEAGRRMAGIVLLERT